MSDDALSGMVARLNDFEQRYEHDQLALQSMARQLEEMKSEREAKEQTIQLLRADLARLTKDRDGWRVGWMRMVADRTYVSEEV